MPPLLKDDKEVERWMWMPSTSSAEFKLKMSPKKKKRKIPPIRNTLSCVYCLLLIILFFHPMTLSKILELTVNVLQPCQYIATSNKVFFSFFFFSLFWKERFNPHDSDAVATERNVKGKITTSISMSLLLVVGSDSSSIACRRASASEEDDLRDLSKECFGHRSRLSDGPAEGTSNPNDKHPFTL